jgi:hypothetical protein
MKKILLLFAALGSLTLSSCTDDDRPDNDTIAEVFELTDIDFAPDGSGRYTVLYPLQPTIFDSDVVLVYRIVNDEGFLVKQPIPRTLYLDGGDEIDYDFNFTSEDILFIMDANFDLADAPAYTQNQSFRVAIVPGYFSSTVDVNDYDAVMAALKNKNGGKEITIQTIQ